MSNLVGNDICPGKIARSFELAFEFAKEIKIQIELVIARTVKRPHGGARVTTRGRKLAVVQDKNRVTIILTGLLRQDRQPGILGTSHNDADELFVLISGLIYGIT